MTIDRDQVIAHERQLSRCGVRHAALFGSVTRKQVGPGGASRSVRLCRNDAIPRRPTRRQRRCREPRETQADGATLRGARPGLCVLSADQYTRQHPRRLAIRHRHEGKGVRGGPADFYTVAPLPRDYFGGGATPAAGRAKTTSELPWRAITGAGNVYRHDYGNVAEAIVWRTVQRSLVSLLAAVESQIGRLSN